MACRFSWRSMASYAANKSARSELASRSAELGVGEYPWDDAGKPGVADVLS
jgi:hypothetical protein